VGLNNRTEVVPRRTLELCKDTLRRCLEARAEVEQRLQLMTDELEQQLRQAHAEVDRLQRALDSRRR
jgi:multidrug resistance efflux pump